MDDRGRIEGRRGPAILLVYPKHHAVGEAVAETLRTAGAETVRVESVYAAVIALAAEPSRFAAAVLAIDFFNREELRFFPLAKRRWPDLITVALSEPPFSYKAAIADLAGADFICCDAARAANLVERLTERQTSGIRPQTSDAAKEEKQEETTASPSSAGGFNGKKNGTADEPVIGERKRPAPRPVEPKVEPKEDPPVIRMPLADLPKKPAVPPQAPQDILTEEELAALMENMEEDDLPNE